MTAAFEHAQNVAGLRSLPAEERIELWNHVFGESLFGSRLWRRLDRLRQSVAVVAFAEPRIFCGIAAVVVQRGAPQHSCVGHHAGGNSARFGSVAACSAAGFGSDAQVARVHELDVFSGFCKPLCESAFGKIRTVPETRIARLDVGLLLRGTVFGRISRGTGCR